MLDETPKAPAQIMYLGVGTAIPTEKNLEYPVGKRHALLIFVLATSLESARTLAKRHFETTNWESVLIDRINAVDTTAIQQAQADIINAYELALRDGSHGMVLNRAEAT